MDHSDQKSALLKRRIEHALGNKMLASSFVGVGFGLTGLRGRLADGRQIFVKAGEAGKQPSPQLGLEAFMLNELARHTNLPVPEVFYADDDLLIMRWIETAGGGISPAAEHHAAEILAEAHAKIHAVHGYEKDTLIGPLHQPNMQDKSWISFFRTQRLDHMSEKAHKEGRLPGKMRHRLEKLSEVLENYLTEPAHPALLHGDLWSGNILVDGDKIAGLIDPAIYCGHPEIELAFTTLFSTFGTAFFDAYESLAPLEPGFHDLRREIYNIYPNLVHVRLFGSSYLPPIDRLLSRLGL